MSDQPPPSRRSLHPAHAVLASLLGFCGLIAGLFGVLAGAVVPASGLLLPALGLSALALFVLALGSFGPSRAGAAAVPLDGADRALLTDWVRRRRRSAVQGS